MFGYIYETTNLVNGKKYIGKRKSKVFLDDYFGSGILITKAVKKYGKANFIVRIIEKIDGDRDVLNEREQYWIKYYDAVNNDNFYNISKGGDGGFHSLETNEKIRNTLKGKTYEERFGLKRANEIKEKISKSNTGKHHSEEMKKRLSESKMGENNPMFNLKGELSPFFGRNLSKEVKEKISISVKNHFNNLSDDEKNRRREAQILAQTGSKRSEETKARMKAAQNRPEVKKKRSESLKNVPRTDEWRQKISEATKGKIITEEQKQKISNTIKGSKWMNNGVVSLQVKPHEIDKYILQGYMFGTLRKKHNSLK